LFAVVTKLRRRFVTLNRIAKGTGRDPVYAARGTSSEFADASVMNRKSSPNTVANFSKTRVMPSGEGEGELVEDSSPRVVGAMTQTQLVSGRYNPPCPLPSVITPLELTRGRDESWPHALVGGDENEDPSGLERELFGAGRGTAVRSPRTTARIANTNTTASGMTRVIAARRGDVCWPPPPPLPLWRSKRGKCLAVKKKSRTLVDVFGEALFSFWLKESHFVTRSARVVAADRAG
jgi:hypothetical protein